VDDRVHPADVIDPIGEFPGLCRTAEVADDDCRGVRGEVAESDARSQVRVSYCCPALEPHLRRYRAASFASRCRPREIKVIGWDASAVAGRDADKVRLWLSRR